MIEESTTMIVEQPHFEDPIAARGEAILRMCVGTNQVEDPEAKAVLLRGAERLIASIPVAPGEKTPILGVAGKTRM